MAKTKPYVAGTCRKCGTKLIRHGDRIRLVDGRMLIERGYMRCPKCSRVKPA